jgi:hypothetical protein
MQSSACLITIVLLLVNAINGQIDFEICPRGATAPGHDPKWSTIPHRFEIMTELITGNDVVEFSQAFSALRDAISINYKNGNILFY